MGTAGCVFSMAKGRGRETDHSPPFNAEVKNERRSEKSLKMKNSHGYEIIYNFKIKFAIYFISFNVNVQ
jgi:hypothetical protein